MLCIVPSAVTSLSTALSLEGTAMPAVFSDMVSAYISLYHFIQILSATGSTRTRQTFTAMPILLCNTHHLSIMLLTGQLFFENFATASPSEISLFMP